MRIFYDVLFCKQLGEKKKQLILCRKAVPIVRPNFNHNRICGLGCKEDKYTNDRFIYS